MAKGNNIIVSSEPRGRIVGGTVETTINAGRIVQIDVSEGLQGDGRPVFEAYNAGFDGERRPIGVLLPPLQYSNDHQYAGTTAAPAQCRVYYPLPGDELNVILDDASGTAAISFGDLLIVDDGTGGVVTTWGTAESEPFQALEAATPDTTQQLIHVLYTGY